MKNVTRILTTVFLLIWAVFLNAQTTIISATGDGGFETGATFAANGWTVVNGVPVNRWVCSTGATTGFSGTRCAYITNNDAGGPPPHTYTMTSASAVHLYRDVTFPSGETTITFSFSIRMTGETTWDRLLVYISNSTPSGTPTAGTPSSNGTSLAGYTLLSTQATASSWTSRSVTISAAQAGNSVSSSSRRILFVWQNDAGGGSDPPAAIDNISLVSVAPPPPPANDDPCGAIGLTAGSSCSFTQYTNANATASSTTAGGAIPTPGCSSYLGGDVWFSVTVPAGGALIFDSNTGVVTDGGMAIYSSSDNTCNGLFTLIECDDDDSANGAMPYISRTGLTPGSTVFVRFFEYDNNNNGTFSICVSTPPAVPNCATLNTPANGATGVVRNTPLTWTAAGTGGTPSGYKVYLGTAPNPSLTTTVTHPTATYTPSGQAYSTTYYWRIVPTNGTGDAVGCTTEFTYTTEAAPPPPANDLCANATVITQAANTSTTYAGTNASATASSPALQACGNSNAGVDVWYTFASTATGTVQFNLEADGTNGSTSFDSQIQIFSSTCPGAATVCVTQGDDGGNPIGDSNDPPTINLAATAGTTYYARIYNWAISGTGNFNLQIITPAGLALPLELLSFTGKTTPRSNMLLWETLTEKNVEWHIVERSIDGVKWVEVGRKAGQMDSQASLKYELEDRAPLAKSYYRLRSVDFDGQENLSNSIVLTRKGEHFGITAAFPSPTKDQVTVQFASLTEENVTIRVTDFAGRLVLVQEYAADNGINEVPVQLTSLQAGVYLISISNATSMAEPMRIVKE